LFPTDEGFLQSTNPILMVIVGLMLAGCGSMENHVRNAPRVLPDRGDTIAVDIICACP
jgi:hypothetical protein